MKAAASLASAVMVVSDKAGKSLRCDQVVGVCVRGNVGGLSASRFEFVDWTCVLTTSWPQDGAGYGLFLEALLRRSQDSRSFHTGTTP